MIQPFLPCPHQSHLCSSNPSQHSLGGLLNHVVSVPSRDGDKGNSLGVVSDLLDEARSLLDDLLESSLGVLGGVHLVDGDNELPNTEGESEKGVLSGLSVLGDTSLELSGSTGDDEDSAGWVKEGQGEVGDRDGRDGNGTDGNRDGTDGNRNGLASQSQHSTST